MARQVRPGVQGVTYDFQDMFIRVNGQRVLEVVGCDWRNTRNSSVIFGQGEIPIGIGQGEVSVEGSLTAKVSPNVDAEISAVLNPRTVAPARSFVEWGPVELVITYGTVAPFTSRTFTIVFNDEGESGSQGDLGLEMTLSFLGILNSMGTPET